MEQWIMYQLREWHEELSGDELGIQPWEEKF